MKIIEQPFASPWRLFSYLSSAGMLVVLAVASCTSTQTFSEIYNLVAEFLRLSKTSMSMTIRESAGLGHFICYTVLSLSLTGVFSHRHTLLAPLVALGFGVLMESVQIFIPSRDASLLDVGINFLGVSLGFGVYWVWSTYNRKRDSERIKANR